MKNLFTILLFLFGVITCFSQPIVPRTNSSYTVQDARFSARLNLLHPRYADTISANLSKGIDTCGATIYLYSTHSLWYRSCLNGKSWVEIGSGGGSYTASSGITLTSADFKLGQSIGQAGNPAVLTRNTEIPMGLPYPAGTYKFSFVHDISALSPGYPYAKWELENVGTMVMESVDGSTIRFVVLDSAASFGSSFPAVLYYTGYNRTLQAFTGMHWTPTDKHFDLVDMRGSIANAQIQSGGVGVAAFDADGEVRLGLSGLKKVGMGTSVANLRATLDVNGTSWLVDTLQYQKRLYETDSTGFDVAVIRRGTPYDMKRMTVPSLATLIAGSVNTIYTGDGTLSSDRTVDLNGKFLSFQEGGNTLLFIDPVNFTSKLEINDNTAVSSVDLVSNSGINDVTFRIRADNGTDEVKIDGDATANSLTHTADTHTFNGVEIFMADIPATDTTGYYLARTASGQVVLSAKVSAGMTNPMTTAGDIIVGGVAGAPARLGIGTALQQVRVNAGGTAIEYFTPAAGGVAWGAITGTLSDQTDLQTALNLKSPLASPTFTGTVTIPTPFTLGAVSVTPTGTELNFVDGVTSAIQTQLDTKAPLASPTFTTSITGSYLTASEILITDGSKNIVSAPVATYPSLTEFTYVKGVTSAIQTQLDAKGTGNVTKVGTPVDNQVGVWTGDGTLEGPTTFLYDGTKLDLWTGYAPGMIIGGDIGAATRTNITNKFGRIAGAHYTNAEEPIALISYSSTSGNSLLQFGLGTNPGMNGVTGVEIYTSTTVTTLGGTRRALFGISTLGLNEGLADYDIIIGGDTDANLFRSDASTDRVGIGIAAPATKLDVVGVISTDGLNLDRTITAAGTTGNQTINKVAGTVNIAAAGTTVTVTNSLVDASSIIHCVVRTNDATARIANVVPGAGSFVINIVACTAEVSIGFFVTN